MPAQRGRRDPEVAARIAQNRPVPGRNRQAPEEQPPASIALPDVPLAEPIDVDELNDAGEYGEDLPMLFPGDVVMAKVVHTVEIEGLESWFTYGVQSRVQPDENEEEAFARVCTVANSRVLDFISDAEDRIAEETARRQAIAAAQREDRQARAAAAGAGGGGTGRIQPRSRQR